MHFKKQYMGFGDWESTCACFTCTENSFVKVSKNKELFHPKKKKKLEFSKGSMI